MISYLEYCQLILRKVSFDRKLFNKEYRKAVRLLSNDQQRALEEWIQSMGYAHLIASAKGSAPEELSRQVPGSPPSHAASFTSES
jgi:hypothetical protein